MPAAPQARGHTYSWRKATIGSILAARLTEDEGVTVCVLEAGPPDYNPYIHIPAGFIKTLFDERVTWQFKTAPTDWTGGRRIATTQGDEVRGVLPLGQATGLVGDVPTVAELLDRIVSEAERAGARLAAATA